MSICDMIEKKCFCFMYRMKYKTFEKIKYFVVRFFIILLPGTEVPVWSTGYVLCKKNS